MELAVLSDWWTRHSRKADAIQYGAMPYQIVDGRVVFLLITSRRTGRWIFPKGGLIDGMTPQQSAAQEAYEEAGVRGVVEPTPLGTYQTVKHRISRKLIDVQVFALQVEERLEDWPEMEQRRRHWVLFGEAKRLLSDRGAVEAARRLNKRTVGADA